MIDEVTTQPAPLFEPISIGQEPPSLPSPKPTPSIQEESDRRDEVFANAVNARDAEFESAVNKTAAEEQDRSDVFARHVIPETMLPRDAMAVARQIYIEKYPDDPSGAPKTLTWGPTSERTPVVAWTDRMEELYPQMKKLYPDMDREQIRTAMKESVLTYENAVKTVAGDNRAAYYSYSKEAAARFDAALRDVVSSPEFEKYRITPEQQSDRPIEERVGQGIAQGAKGAIENIIYPLTSKEYAESAALTKTGEAARETVSPLGKPDSLADRALIGASRSAAFTLGGMAAAVAGGAPAAFLFTLGQTTPDAYREYKAAGVPSGYAELAAMATGGLEALIEQAISFERLAGLRGLPASSIRDAFVKTLKEYGVVTLGETAEEISQNVSRAFFGSLASKGFTPEILSDAMSKGLPSPDQLAEIVATSGILTAPGQVHALMAMDFARKNPTKMLPEHPSRKEYEAATGVKNSNAAERDEFAKAVNEVVAEQQAPPEIVQSAQADTEQIPSRSPTDHFADTSKKVSVGDTVDGRIVREDIPNLSSIRSSMENPTELGVREIEIAAFQDSGKPQFYSKSERERTERLAEQIRQSGEISPLIVVFDGHKDGPYVLEGAHRFDALKLLGAKSFPALVVLDNDAIAESQKNESPAAPPVVEAKPKRSREEIRKALFSGGKPVDIAIVDDVSDYQTLDGLLETKELRDGIYVVGDDVVEVSNGVATTRTDLHAEFDYSAKKYRVNSRDFREQTKNIFYHGSREKVDANSLKPGTNYGPLGPNEYRAVYVTANPDDATMFSHGPNKTVVELRIKDSAKIVSSREANKIARGAADGINREDALRAAGVDAVGVRNRRGDYQEIAILNTEIIEPVDVQGEYGGLLDQSDTQGRVPEKQGESGRIATPPKVAGQTQTEATNEAESQAEAPQGEKGQAEEVLDQPGQGAVETPPPPLLTPVEQARAEYRKAIADFTQEGLGSLFTGGALNPKLLGAFTKVVYSAIKLNILKFADFVKSLADEIGSERVFRSEQLLRHTWDEAAKRDNRLDASVPIAPLLADYKGPTEKPARPDLAIPVETPDAKKFFEDVDAIRNRAGRPDVRPDEAVNAEAASRAAHDPQEIRDTVIGKGASGEQLTDVEVAAAKKVMDADISAALKSGNPADIEKAATLVDMYRETGTEQARSFRQRREDMTATQQLKKMIFTPPPKKKGETVEQREEKKQQYLALTQNALVRINEMGIDLTKPELEPEEFVAAAQTMRDARSEIDPPSWWKALWEYRIAAMLSSPVTLVVNTISTAIYYTYHRLLKASVGAAIGNLARQFGYAKDAPTFKEIGYVIKAFIPAWAAASRNLVSTFKSEVPMFDFAMDRIGITEINSRTPATGTGPVGRTIRLPLRMMSAADQFAKTQIACMEVAAHAYRIGLREGLDGLQLEQRMYDLVSDKSSEAWDRAVNDAEELTFTTRLAPFFRNLLKSRNDHPWLQLFFPFVTTPVNIFKAGLRAFTPLGTISLAKAAYRGEQMRAVQYAAEQTLVWMMILALSDNDPDDPWITGSPAVDPSARDEQYRSGRPPQSIKVGETWYSYSRIDPIGIGLASIVDTLTGWRKGGTEGAMGAASQTLFRQAMNKTFMQGVADVVETAQQIASGQSAGGTGLKYGLSQIRTFVPNIIMSVARAADETYNEQRAWGKGWELGNRIFNRAMEQTELVGAYPKRDLWGREIERSHPFNHYATDFVYRLVSPIGIANDETTQADLAIAKYNSQHAGDEIFMRFLSPTFTFAGLDFSLTDKQYDDYARLSGELASKIVEKMNLDYSDVNSAAFVVSAVQTARDSMKGQLIGYFQGRELPNVNLELMSNVGTIIAKRSALSGLRPSMPNIGPFDSPEAIQLQIQNAIEKSKQATERVGALP